MKTKEKYLLAHEESDVNLISILLNARAFAHPIFKVFLKMPNFYDHWLLFNKGDERWFCNSKIFNAVSDEVAKRIISDKRYSQKIIKRSQSIGKKLHKECYAAMAEMKNNKLLCVRWSNIFELFYQLCALGLGAVMSDLEHHRFSRQLDALINKKIKTYKFARSLGEYIGVLIQSPMLTYTLSAKKELLTLLKFQKNSQKLEQYLFKYRWLNYGHRGPALSLAGLKKQLAKLSENKPEVRDLRTAININSLNALQKKYNQELRLNGREKRLLAAARDFNGVKAYRMDLMSLTFYTLGLAINNLSRQTKVPVSLLHNLMPQEFLTALRAKKMPTSSILKQRFNKSVSLVQTFNKMSILTEKRADAFLQKNLPQSQGIKESSEIRGFVASAGKARGVVKIIKNVKDIHKVHKGDILVAAQTIPQYLPAMYQAVAFITDVGGITSHAAIVAREMKKPCIIGTKIATQVLHDGDLVEVDANKGVVKIIK